MSAPELTPPSALSLTSLTLTNFKNIAQTTLEFSPKVNCLVGNNGMGKSNLLDAIHYMSFCRSFTGVGDALLINRGQDFAMARALYRRRDTDEELTLGLARGRRRSLRRGGKEYRRLSEHIGLFPLVMVAPGDIDLVRGGGEERRRWIDMVICQADPLYLDALMRYNAALEQRNRMLRDRVVDHTLYEVVEMTLCAAATTVHAARARWTERLQELFATYYSAVAGGSEMPRIAYTSTMNRAPLATLLDEARRHDEIVGHTSVGPHRDDIDMTLDELPMRRTGSQGQCKTFTIALRLAQWRFLREASGLKPLLLLDDIFDKLDAGRVERIMELVADESFGQIFITDTNRIHLDEIIERAAGGGHRLWSVADGNFLPA